MTMESRRRFGWKFASANADDDDHHNEDKAFDEIHDEQIDLIQAWQRNRFFVESDDSEHVENTDVVDDEVIVDDCELENFPYDEASTCSSGLRRRSSRTISCVGGDCSRPTLRNERRVQLQTENLMRAFSRVPESFYVSPSSRSVLTTTTTTQATTKSATVLETLLT